MIDRQKEKTSDCGKSINSTHDEIQHPSDVIGSFGPTQKRVLCYLIVIYICGPFSNSHFLYTAPPRVDFWCIDFDPSTNKTVFLKNSCTIGNYSDAPPCTRFEHDTSFHKRTLVNAFDLVCKKAWYPSFGQSCHQFGYAISGVVIGLISDNYGRFFAAKVSIVLEIVAGFGQAFAPSIYWYWFARVFVGMAAYGRYLNGYILINEWVGPKLRGKISSSVYEVGAYVGSILLLAAFYFYPDYVYIELTVRAVEIILFVGFTLVVKESPRWLLTHGKWEEATKLLKSAALEAGKFKEEEIDRRIEKLQQFTMREHEKMQEMNKRSSILMQVVLIWRDIKLLKTSLILYFSWFTISFIAYGSWLNSGQLGLTIYGMALFAKFMWPLDIALFYYCTEHFERKKLGRSCLYVMMLGLFVSILLSLHPSLLIPLFIVGSLKGKATQLSFNTLYLMTTEFFPTDMRQTSVGICSIFARIGSMIAPFMKELTLATSLWVSFAIFAALTVATAILWLLLPETMDIQLPDNILQTRKVGAEEEILRRHSQTPRQTSRSAS